jgi:hypothetical protein
MDEPADPVALVTTFLTLMEARDLERAAEYVADDVLITFPGGRTFSSLEDQVASSGGRFRSVTKSFDGFDVCRDASTPDQVTVYCFGTLAGERLDQTPFDGVRFIDRFVIRDGRIVDQQVWNDVAESGILPD